MNLLSFLRKPEPIDTTDLRDRLIEAETQLTLLRDLIEHPRRGREIRCDAKSYKDAKSDTTQRLRRSLAAQGNFDLAEAIDSFRSDEQKKVRG